MGGRGEYRYLVESYGVNATVYDYQGIIVHGPGAVDETEINWALTNLTAGRTRKETVVVTGNFIINNPILVPDYVILDLSEAYIRLANTRNLDMIQNRNQDATGNQHFEILGGILNGNKANNLVAGHGIHLDHCHYATVRGVVIYDCRQRGIHFYSDTALSDYCEINENRVSTCQWEGIYIHNVWYSVIGWNFTYSNISDGLSIQAGLGRTIIGNVSVYNQDDGITIGSGGESSINDNTSALNSDRGIHMSGGGAYAIVGNTIFGNGQEGIRIDGTACNINTIAGNYIYDNGGNTLDQIYIAASRNVVSSNVIGCVGTGSNQGRDGVRIVNASNCSVVDNLIENLANAGVQLYGASSCLVSGNVIVNGDNYGILLDADANYNRITENFTQGNAVGCARVNNANCDNNVFTNNNFDEGNISDIGTATRAWLNYDPSANIFIATINPPTDSGGDTLP